MKTIFATVAVVCMLNSPATNFPIHSESEALDIIERYMAIPHSERDILDGWRSDRLSVLQELKSIPEQASLAISFVLPRASSFTHRVELVELLGRLPVTTSAGLLVSLLSDPEPKVRYYAVLGLRWQSSRITRSGLKNAPVKPLRDPGVKGLVPFLAEAVGDDDNQVARTAIVALADTREDEALRRLMDDPSDRDRIGFYFDAEKILLAFERLTGESLGEIPINPHLYSSFEAGKSAAETYENLLGAWGDYFATTSFRE